MDRPSDDELVPKRVFDLLPERIALLDEGGRVAWMNASWLDDPPDAIDGLVPRARVGESLLHPSDPPDAPSPVGGGIRAVVERKASHFELELAESGAAGLWRVSATRLGLGPVVVIIKQGRPVRQVMAVREDRAENEDGADAGPPVPSAKADETTFGEELTPREREVLDGMMRGLDNHSIARELGIGYTSVRAHVRSLIAKAGARSRLEVVARAYRSRLGTNDHRHGDAPASGKTA